MDLFRDLHRLSSHTVVTRIIDILCSHIVIADRRFDPDGIRLTYLHSWKHNGRGSPYFNAHAEFPFGIICHALGNKQRDSAENYELFVKHLDSLSGIETVVGTSFVLENSLWVLIERSVATQITFYLFPHQFLYKKNALPIICAFLIVHQNIFIHFQNR